MMPISEQERLYFNDTLAVDALTHEYERVSLVVPRELVHQLEQTPLLEDFLITWAGYYSHALGHVAKRTDEKGYFPDYILHYCVKGSGFQKVGEYYTNINPGDVCVCHADLPHHYGSNPADPWDIFWVCFRGRQVEPLLKILGITLENPVLHVGENSALRQGFYDIFETLRNPATLNNILYASSQLKCMLALLAAKRSYNLKEATAGFSAEAVINLMYRNIHANLDLSYFAGAAGMSKHYFDRKFREITGYSVMEQFGWLKINRACDLLTGTNLSIKEISQTLGFCNPYYFSQRFKQTMGFSPRRYRQVFQERR